MQRRILTLTFVLCMALGFGPSVADAFKGGQSTPAGVRKMNRQPAPSFEIKYRSFSKAEIDRMARTTAVIKTGFGDIKLMFYPDLAPNHVDNFIRLAKSGFYDETIFHRIIPGFMIQGGDPKSKGHNRAGWGTGNPGYFMKAEFNRTPHKRGILSTARGGSPDSAGSQFFICVADKPHLDNQYTVFGKVVSGMNVVDRLVKQPRDSNNKPFERAEIKIVINEPVQEKTESAEDGSDSEKPAEK